MRRSEAAVIASPKAMSVLPIRGRVLIAGRVRRASIRVANVVLLGRFAVARRKSSPGRFVDEPAGTARPAR
jgi:hypothetical protein